MPLKKNWGTVRSSEKNTLLFLVFPYIYVELETEMLPKTN